MSYQNSPSSMDNARHSKPAEDVQSPRGEIYANEMISGFEPEAEYGKDRVVLLVREPGWVYAYWEATPQSLESMFGMIPLDERSGVNLVIRVFSPTLGGIGSPFIDLAAPAPRHSWHINVGQTDVDLSAAFGYLTAVGNFYEIARSNAIIVPSGRESEVSDEEWLTLEELYKGSPIEAGSSPGFWLEKNIVGRGGGYYPTSPGIFSPMGGSPTHYMEAQGFRLQVGTELVLYGQSEPGAVITVNGEKVKTTPDGSFSVRYALNDTSLVLPVQAVSKDGTQKATITPVVTKKTY